MFIKFISWFCLKSLVLSVIFFSSPTEPGFSTHSTVELTDRRGGFDGGEADSTTFLRPTDVWNRLPYSLPVTITTFGLDYLHWMS